MTYATRLPKIVGSAQPSAGVLTSVTVIDNNSNAYGSVFVANVSDSTVETVRLLIRPAEDALGPHQYLLWDTPIEPQGMLIIANIGLQGGAQLMASSAQGQATFNLTGDQIINNN
jgi:hypothetical protein